MSEEKVIPVPTPVAGGTIIGAAPKPAPKPGSKKITGPVAANEIDLTPKSEPEVPPEVEVASKPAPIQVVALQAGFRGRTRVAPGTKFHVSDMSKVGEWMKCVDPKLEAQHQHAMKEKRDKAKAKKLAGK